MQGILTLQTSSAHSTHDLQRAKILVESLDRMWLDAAPFDLTVIALDRDFDRICDELRPERTRITFIRETELLPCLRRCPPVIGWHKQQVLKLAACRLIHDPFYLVLDADIVCCQTFSTESLVVERKAVTDWARRRDHPDWWQGSAEVLSLPLDMDRMGMGVTPEVFSTQICAALQTWVSGHYGMDCWEYLLSDRRWTEYSLYCTFAIDRHLMFDHHHGPGWMVQNRRSLKVQDNLWSRDHYSDWSPEASLRAGAAGIFMVCQSNTGINPDLVRRRLQPVFDRPIPRP